MKIRLQGGVNCTDRGVDLDQPMVNADQTTSDLTFTTCRSSSPELDFVSDNVALAKAPDTSPAECAQTIQLSPTNSDVALSQDLTICAVTNGDGAVNEPSRVKMARIQVNSVAKDGSAVLTITTWELPT